MNITSFIVASLFLASPNLHAKWINCNPVPATMTQAKVSRFQQDPEQFVKEALSELHSHIGKNFRAPSAKRKQLATLTKYYSLGLWMGKVHRVLSYSTADAFQKAEMEYLFASWIRERYMGNVKRSVRDRELQEIYKQRGEYSSKVKQHVINHPGEPLVTGYASFSCQNEEESRAYTCADPHLIVNVQLSPQGLCNKPHLAKTATLKVLLHKTKVGFRIADIEQNGRYIYQNAYRDFNKLIKKHSLGELKSLLSKWSFTTPDELIQAEINSFSEMLKGLPNLDESQRMPANAK